MHSMSGNRQFDLTGQRITDSGIKFGDRTLEEERISEEQIDTVIRSTPLPRPPGNYWRISECSELLNKKESPFRMKEFNHLTKECLNLEVSIKFYQNLLGFREVLRPPFESEGCWLWGYGLNLHLIQSKNIKERQVSDMLRLMHHKGMPIADHFAFLVDNVKEIEEFLDANGVLYYQDDSKHTGTYQIFLFDPDFNVVEISNCAPPVGEIRCVLRSRDPDGESGSACSGPLLSHLRTY